MLRKEAKSEDPPKYDQAIFGEKGEITIPPPCGASFVKGKHPSTEWETCYVEEKEEDRTDFFAL